MMLHQDASTHEWVPGVKWDLVVTMDNATNEHYSMRLVAGEGTASSFMGMRDVIRQCGLFASLYTDRGSHYWYTPEAGGKVAKEKPTPVGKAMARLGIEMIPAYSPKARGRSERMSCTHPGASSQELAIAGIRDMTAANRYFDEVYRPAFNAEFMPPALERDRPSCPGSAASWMTSCVKPSSVSSAKTTAWPSRGWPCRSPRAATGCIT